MLELLTHTHNWNASYFLHSLPPPLPIVFHLLQAADQELDKHRNKETPAAASRSNHPMGIGGGFFQRPPKN